MTKKTENNPVQETSSVIYVNFKAQRTMSTAATHTPEQIYALFAPRFGSAFTEWFIDQYKTLEA